MGYNPDGYALSIFEQRYAWNGETWYDACERVAKTLAAVEGVNAGYWSRQFYYVLSEGLFSPGGRVWYGAGRPKGQLANCYVIPTADSREGWGKAVSDTIVITGTGGGVGINCSPVRPRGAAIHGAGGTASGAVSFMRIVNAAANEIRGNGSRKAALMLCLNIDHPDLLEFIQAKCGDTPTLTNANISVVFNTPPADFIRLVEQDKLHTMQFGDTTVTAPARQIWESILAGSVKSGDPGILNMHLANAMNNIWYHAPLTATNPCGEIAMCDYDSCNLGALVLPRFVTDRGVDWGKLEHAITIAVRLLDDVIDANHYPLPEVQQVCKTIRRIGLGVMGLHDMLVMLGMKYTSDDAFLFVDKLMEFIKIQAYRASIDIAKSKGPFPAFDRKFTDSGFCKTLPDDVVSDIYSHGIRNCAVLTIAPTGTTSIVQGVSSGIEPVYAPVYRRRWRQHEDVNNTILTHPLFEHYAKIGSPKARLFESALEIPPAHHLRMQAVCQRHIDNAISKTINLPKYYTAQDIDAALRTYAPHVKGVTIYRDGSHGDSPLEPVQVDAYLAAVHGRVEVSSAATSVCANGSCEL